MDFFAQQARTLRLSRIYTVLFVLVVICITLCINLLVHIGILILEDSATPFTAGEFVFIHSLVIIITVGGIVSASALRISTLRKSGGCGLAEELGGVPAGQNVAYRQLVNVVEEMAVAAGIPVPGIYVLPEETGINALAAGYNLTDAAVVFSQGAINTLGRDELQAVAGHELSHILSGDMRLNMLLMGMLHGVSGIGNMGKVLVRSSMPEKNSSAGSNNSRGELGLLAAGMALWLLGALGLLFSRMLQAAVSRQREFMADAFSVQLTRNPEGLTGALAKIASARLGSELDNARNEDVAHMCVAACRPIYFSFFDTHPPLEKRILAVDSGFDLTRLEKTSAEEIPLVAQPGPEAAKQHTVRASLPPELLEAAHSPGTALALLPALVIADAADMQTAMLAKVEEVLGKNVGELCEGLMPRCDHLPAGLTLPLVDAAFPALKQMDEVQRTALTGLLPVLAKMNGRISLFGYCTCKLLELRLNLAKQELPGKSALAGKGAMAEAVQRLFAVMAMFGAPDAAGEAKAFNAGIKLVLRKHGDYRRPQNWTKDLDFSLDILTRLGPRQRVKIVRGLMAVVKADSVVNQREVLLLRLILACFNMPSSGHDA